MKIIGTVEESKTVSSSDPQRKNENSLLLNKLNKNPRTPKEGSPPPPKKKQKTTFH